ncbi:kinase-like domain-containing protein [Aspergillus carlsbadensis]|nr:kinase-like domain-containing protein [Aspergillus carlsbadensis]
MSPLSDLVRDSLLATTFPGIGSSETVHVYHERSLRERRQVARSEHWIRRGRIGQGGFASVWREERADQSASDREKPAMRAVKEINLQGRAGRVDYTRELEAIAKFSQRKYDQIGCFVKSYGWYQTAESLFIAMEYLELGDLQTYLLRDEQPPLPECEAQDIVYQMLYGLREMHENNFVHRDLKLGVGSPPQAHRGRAGHADNYKGTPGYMAPELQGLAERGEPYTIDIWAAGEITFQLLTKTPAFPNAGALGKYMTNADAFPFAPLHDANVSDSVVAFILSLMRPIPQDRASAAGALDHSWIRQTLPIPTEPATRAYSGPYTNPSAEAMTEEFASWNTVTSTNIPTTIVPSKPDSSTKFSHLGPTQAHSDHVGVSIPPPPPSIPRIKPSTQIAPTPAPPPTYPRDKPSKLPGYKPRSDDTVLLAEGSTPSRPERSTGFSPGDTEHKRSTPPPRRIPRSRSYQDLSSVKEPSRRAQSLPLPGSETKIAPQEAPRKYHSVSRKIRAYFESLPKPPEDMS